jgi:hypothetical protein
LHANRTRTLALFAEDRCEAVLADESNLTSTYFESDAPLEDDDKRRHGYSRDHRPDFVHIVIALIVAPDGLPLTYEVMPGNTNDSTTLRGFLARIEAQYGRAEHVWCMDRGVPTETVLEELAARSVPHAQLGRQLKPLAQGLTARSALESSPPCRWSTCTSRPLTAVQKLLC